MWELSTLLSYRTKWGKVSFWPKIVEVVFLLTEAALTQRFAFFDVALLSINSIGGWGFNWQLCQDSFIEGQSKSPHLLMLRSTKSVRCVGIFRIWWAQAMIAVIGVFLAPNYRPTISLSWPRVGSASNFNQTLGRLNRRKENICLAGSTIREFGGSRWKIARNCVARTRLRGRGSQTNSTIKRFRTFVGRCFQMDLKFCLLFSGSGHDLFLSRYTLASEVAENKFSIKIKTMKVSSSVWNICIEMDCKTKILGRNIRIVA